VTLPRPFGLQRPSTLGEAADLLRQTDGEGVLYAGGTELLILLKRRAMRPTSLIDLKRIPGLGDITATRERLVIGATATHRALERAPAVVAGWPLVARAVRHVANIRVRNVGTVGGNVAFADPHSDLSTLFQAFDATVELTSADGAREVPLGELVRGPYETTRRADEILTAVSLRRWPETRVGAYLKFGLYERPTVTVAVGLGCDETRAAVRDARVIVGSVGPRPARLHAAERAIAGEALAELPRRLGEIAAAATEDIEAMADLHGARDYKRELARVCLGRALGVAVTRALGASVYERHPHTLIV
jgi:aerobic carbon-monoxide dehydrogenase medium subunit